MRLHRFYLPDVELGHKVWLHDERLISQWVRVLRLRENDHVVLFDGVRHERQYEIIKIEDKSIGLVLVTDHERKVPSRHVYLFWSLLKKDKDEWVLQKCTELGVSDFVPLLSERTIATGFDEDRARKIVIEASEQCGRSDIPRIREPVRLETALDEFKGKMPLFYAQMDGAPAMVGGDVPAVGVFIGPEGGWSDDEMNELAESCTKLGLSDFTLRAETAALVAGSVLLQAPGGHSGE